jgi:hypothetical protein
MANNIVEVFRSTIKLGAIEIDAYTANERDNQGNWINYLSGKGMAECIGLEHTTTVQNRLSEELKALLGETFTTVQSKYRNQRNSFSKVNLWTIPNSRKYWRYHDRNGNKLAGAIVDALVETSIDIIINDAFSREYQRGDAQLLVNSRILDRPSPWKRLYEKEFCDRVFSWYGASFYWTFCYDFLTVEERCKLNKLNPPVNGNRKHRIHQYLEPETKARLEPQIDRLLTVVDCSRSKQQFSDNFQRTFGRTIQLEIELQNCD